MLCFTETWLKDTIDDSLPVRTDCDPLVTGKKVSGGVCVYVNERWCKNFTLRESYCSEDIELLSLSLRPFYLPSEFGQLFITIVYIHPRTNFQAAGDVIYDVVSRLENIAPDALKFVLGDFNVCSLVHVLPHFYQYITCPTRGERVLDLCFGNIKSAFKGYSNHP